MGDRVGKTAKKKRRRPAAGRQHLETERERAHRRVDQIPIDGRGGNQDDEERRQQPGGAILRPLQQDGRRDDEKRRRIEPEQREDEHAR